MKFTTTRKRVIFAPWSFLFLASPAVIVQKWLHIGDWYFLFSEKMIVRESWRRDGKCTQWGPFIRLYHDSEIYD